jgi:hypothetical protein
MDVISGRAGEPFSTQLNAYFVENGIAAIRIRGMRRYDTVTRLGTTPCMKVWNGMVNAA